MFILYKKKLSDLKDFNRLFGNVVTNSNRYIENFYR